VVGGGIAGLVVAHRLASTGRSVTLVEAEPRLGGRVATLRRDGFVLEAGADGFLATPPVLSLIRELGLTEDLVEPLRPGGTAILWRGRLHPLPAGSLAGLPLSPGALLSSSLFGIGEKLRLLADLVLPATPAEPDGPLGPPLRRRLGSAVVERLLEPLLGGLHGGSLDELSAGAIAPWLVEILERGSLLRGFRRLGPRQTARDGGRGPAGLLSLRSGTAELVEALSEAVARRTTCLAARPAVTLKRSPHGWTVTLDDGGRVEATHVVLACPAPVAARLVAPLEGDLARLLDGIPYGSAAVVNLAFRETDLSRAPEGHGVLVPRSREGPLRGASWASRKWPGRAPPGTILVRAFLTEEWAARPEEALPEAAIRSLRPILGARRDPILATVHRFHRAMPRYTVGHLARLAAIDRRLAGLPGLWLVGSAYRGVGIADLVAAAEQTAARIPTD
jgi:oxygen-dependent protoporphyrinogen oxidase